MRTFAEKPKALQQTSSAKFTKPGQPYFKPSYEVDSILHLQRTIGNQAVQRLLQINSEERNAVLTVTASPHFEHDFSRIPAHARGNACIKSKLGINVPKKKYEQEADRVADHVMSMPCPRRQTREPGWEKESRKTEHLLDSSSEGSMAQTLVNDVLRSSGQVLDVPTRTFMEKRLGNDFSQVRVHSDSKAAAAAQALQARAFTFGRDIVFDAQEYRPDSTRGKHLLAHELTHVIQQTGGHPPNRYGETSQGADLCRPAAGIDRMAACPVVQLTAPRQLAFQPKHAPNELVVSKEKTEAKVQSEVARLRGKIPYSWNIFGMMIFDSTFYGDSRLYNFRGEVMRGSELNYYFIAMAMSHQCYTWSGTEFMIDLWNTMQYVMPGDPTITKGMKFAAKEGYFDEAKRRGECWDPTKLDQPFDPMSGF